MEENSEAARGFRDGGEIHVNPFSGEHTYAMTSRKDSEGEKAYGSHVKVPSRSYSLWY